MSKCAVGQKLVRRCCTVVAVAQSAKRCCLSHASMPNYQMIVICLETEEGRVQIWQRGRRGEGGIPTTHLAVKSIQCNRFPITKFRGKLDGNLVI